jgi:hypothetical protein
LKWNLDFRIKKQLFLLLVVSAVLLQCSFFANAISLEQAIQQRTSNVQVKGTGTVIRLLKDDNRGSRHQKFILKLASNKTILIAHNIDLAPRINAISTDDIIAFYGEYEWNNKGGVVHWTHHDPNGHHIGGWLKHNGNTYQ